MIFQYDIEQRIGLCVVQVSYNYVLHAVVFIARLKQPFSPLWHFANEGVDYPQNNLLINVYFLLPVSNRLLQAKTFEWISAIDYHHDCRGVLNYISVTEFSKTQLLYHGLLSSDFASLSSTALKVNSVVPSSKVMIFHHWFKAMICTIGVYFFVKSKHDDLNFVTCKNPSSYPKCKTFWTVRRTGYCAILKLRLKLNFIEYPAIHTNYSWSNCTIWK